MVLDNNNLGDSFISSFKFYIKLKKPSSILASSNKRPQLNKPVSISGDLNRNIKLGLLTRCKNEKYIWLFVKYYISQKVDHIYIIDDNSEDQQIYNNIKNNNQVSIFSKVKNIAIDNPNDLQNYYNRIKNKFDWLIFVDVDEYITTKKM